LRGNAGREERTALKAQIEAATAAKAAANSAQSSHHLDVNAANNRPPQPTGLKPITGARKAGKYGAVALGGAAIVGAGVNEVHRNFGGTQYRGRFDKYRQR
jgi:hypothetical protein